MPAPIYFFFSTPTAFAPYHTTYPASELDIPDSRLKTTMTKIEEENTKTQILEEKNVIEKSFI